MAGSSIKPGSVPFRRNALDRFNDQIPTLEIDVHLYKVTGFQGEITALDCKAFTFCGLEEAKAKDLAPVDRKIVEYLLKER